MREEDPAHAVAGPRAVLPAQAPDSQPQHYAPRQSDGAARAGARAADGVRPEANDGADNAAVRADAAAELGNGKHEWGGHGGHAEHSGERGGEGR